MDNLRLFLHAFLGFFIAICAVVTVYMLVAIWRIFSKAGRPGWGAVVPVYNTYLMLRITGKPGWWVFLYLVPVMNLVISAIVLTALARSFGKDTRFALGLIFLPIAYTSILAFGDAEYIGVEEQGTEEVDEVL